LLLVVVTFKVVPFQVYAMGPAFLPLLQAPLTHILELHVGWSAIVPEFQRHPRNDTLLAVIFFSEAKIITKDQSEE
jgi:hypothetical protein